MFFLVSSCASPIFQPHLDVCIRGAVWALAALPCAWAQPGPVDAAAAEPSEASTGLDEESPAKMGIMSSVRNPCWLMIIGDYTIQYIGDDNNPIGESL